MDELSVEEQRELEEQLYSQVHHTFSTTGTQNEAKNTESSPSVNTSRYLSKRYWIGGNVVSDDTTRNLERTNVDHQNETMNNQNKSWTNKNVSKNDTSDGLERTNSDPQNKTTNNKNKSVTNNNMSNNDNSDVLEKTSSNLQKKTINNKNKSTEKRTHSLMKNPASINKVNPPAANQSKKHERIRNPLAVLAKRENNAKTAKSTSVGLRQKNNKHGLFTEKAQKLQRLTQMDSKRQKSKNIREKLAANPKVIATVDLEDDSSDDEVVLVPLPPVPVYNIDSDDENEVTQQTKNDCSEAQKEELVVENANIDTDTFISPKSTETSIATTMPNDALMESSSRCASPCSIMSQDDFIRQNDRRRLLDNANMADDGDLLLMSNNADSLLEPPTPLNIPGNSNTVVSRSNSSDEIECTGTFLKPNSSLSHKQAGTPKQNYRVNESEFRALDVYESESDIVSDGVYSKGTPKTQLPATIIRNLDESSGEDVEDISLNHQKMKRLRKRRASGSLRGSESAGAVDSSDTDSNDGVTTTAVPFIARGPAVESFKSKKFRKRTSSAVSSGRMSDSEFVATLNSLAQGTEGIENNNSKTNKGHTDCDTDMEMEVEANEAIENVPTAREIAEGVLNSSTLQSTTVEIINDSEKPSTSKAALLNKKKDEAVPKEIADNVKKIFQKINETEAKKAEAEAQAQAQEAIALLDSEENLDNSTVTQNVETGVIEIETDEPADIENEDKTIKYFIGYSPANNECISDGFSWNEEIRRFYNWSWGDEDVTEDDILRTMKRDRRLWRIAEHDRSPNMRRDRREKCINCLSFGHMRSRCPKPKRPLVCYMCGESGHLEPRCPNTRCLRCGSKTTIFCQSCRKCMYWNNRICPICKLRGHPLNDCPDKWRRYHSTTKPNTYPESKVAYNRRRFCCVCGRRGHLADECRKAVNRTEYPIIASYIQSFEKTYDDVILNPYSRKEIPCRLLFDPQVKFNLGIAENVKRNQVYGRFLCAVGLKNLMEKNTSSSRMIKPATTSTVKEKSSNTIDLSITSPEQVAEISEGGNNSMEDINESLATTTSKNNESTTSKSDESTILEERLQMPPPPTPQPLPDMDSDSNYSFSDHFGESVSTNSNEKRGPLPDFIPLGNVNDDDVATDVEKSSKIIAGSNKNAGANFGISARFVESYSDDEHEIDTRMADVPPAPDTNTPCEAKIFISNEHNKYFQSKLGQEYLSRVMAENDLRGRLNSTIVGYALFIHGLPMNQDKLQRELETKFKELNESKQQQYDNSSKVPKRVDVLIRFLRDSINQLYKNLGNASDLYKRLIELDKMQSKNTIKSADRIRRTLNMILLGQAGLNNGDNYVDTILKNLRVLINDFKSIEKIPEDLRDEIDLNWRRLFTPYHHKNYAQLLLSYLKIPTVKRNRIFALKIEPSLLGNSIVDVTLTKEQKERLNNESQTNANVALNVVKSVEQPIMLLNIVDTSQTQNVNPKPKINCNQTQKSRQQTSTNTEKSKTITIQQIKQDIPENIVESQTSSEKKHANGTSTVNKNSNNTKSVDVHLLKPNEKVSTTKNNTSTSKNTSNSTVQNNTSSAAKTDDDATYQRLLVEIEKSFISNKNEADKIASKSASMFWSRESIKFLSELVESTKAEPALFERIERIYQIAKNGGLSYNDYNCVIMLYNHKFPK